MKQRFSTAILWAVLASSLAIVAWTSRHLPPVVASHFDAQGVANGFMPRPAYVGVIAVLLVVAPLLIAFVPDIALRGDVRRVNLPHRDYWLAPERRSDSIDFIRGHGRWFAVMVAVFLVYVHTLVVQANDRLPPRMSTPALMVGLVVFLGALLVWIGRLMRRFRRPPR